MDTCPLQTPAQESCRLKKALREQSRKCSVSQASKTQANLVSARQTGNSLTALFHNVFFTVSFSSVDFPVGFFKSNEILKMMFSILHKCKCNEKIQSDFFLSYWLVNGLFNTFLEKELLLPTWVFISCDVMGSVSL